MTLLELNYLQGQTLLIVIVVVFFIVKCHSTEYTLYWFIVLDQANEVFGQVQVNVEEVDNLVEELANATAPVGVSQFPQDLEATSSIIGRTVAFLVDNLDSPTPSQLKTVSAIQY